MAKVKKTKKVNKVETKGPEYMIQVHEPGVIRKDVLESLREVIIFMQGYEKFKALQEEKLKVFSELRGDLREIVGLTEQLKTMLPKGNLHSIKGEEQEKVVAVQKEKATPVVRQASAVQQQAPNELDELEAQLHDIEGQLNGI